MNTGRLLCVLGRFGPITKRYLGTNTGRWRVGALKSINSNNNENSNENFGNTYRNQKHKRRPASSTNANTSANKGDNPMEVTATAAVADRPFTLPPGQFKPKQSLGQNFLSDQNYVNKICQAFYKYDEHEPAGVNENVVRTFDSESIINSNSNKNKLKNSDSDSDSYSDSGKRVIEVGPGAGALSRTLTKRYPNMKAIEIDQRAIKFLTSKLPLFASNIIHQDVLTVDW